MAFVSERELRSEALATAITFVLALASASPAAAAPAAATAPTAPVAPPARPAAEADDDEEEDDTDETERGAAGPGALQRADSENPRRRRGRGAPAVPVAAGRPTYVETMSGPTGSGRVQVEPRTTLTKPAPGPGQIEQLVQRSKSSVDFFELVDDIIDEIARQIGREDPALLSPMAIRLVRLSANLRPEFARTLEARLVARLMNGTNVKLTVCAECTALRSRVENGQWMVTVGAVRQEDLRRLGETVGIKTFMDLDFTYSAETNVIWMEAVAFRASDGGVVWTDAYRSDGTMASLLRTGRRIPTRAERAAELEQKLAARPNYGYAASLGIAQLPYTAPTGNITGAQVALRFHERFGENQSNLFGLSAGVFTTGMPSEDALQPKALNSILLGAYYSYNLSPPNLNKPELWVYGEAGGMFTGNQGNTFYVESGADLHLKWRLSLSAGLMYILPTTYAGYDLGGVGFRLRVAMNW